MPEREVRLFRREDDGDEIEMFLDKDTVGYSQYGFHLHLSEEECIQVGKMLMDMGTSKLTRITLKLRNLVSNNLKEDTRPVSDYHKETV